MSKHTNGCTFGTRKRRLSESRDRVRAGFQTGGEEVDINIGGLESAGYAGGEGVNAGYAGREGVKAGYARVGERQ